MPSLITLQEFATFTGGQFDSVIAQEGGQVFVQTYLDLASNQVNTDLFRPENKAQAANAYVAAHMMDTLFEKERGPVISQGFDVVSAAYATIPISDEEYGNTRWGRLYLILRNSIVVLPVVGVFPCYG